jgi:hypothetical protein
VPGQASRYGALGNPAEGRADIVEMVYRLQRVRLPRVRISVAIGLGVISIAASVLLVAGDGIGGSVNWTHHAGVSAAPLLLAAGAIAAVSIAHPPNGRHGIMRLVAVFAFAAWGTAQLFPDSGAAGALNDSAILLFVVDAGCAVISDARTLRPRRRPPDQVVTRTDGPDRTSRAVQRRGSESAACCPPAQLSSIGSCERCGCAAAT